MLGIFLLVLTEGSSTVLSMNQLSVTLFLLLYVIIMGCFFGGGKGLFVFCHQSKASFPVCYRTDSDVWLEFVSKPCLSYALRILTGLCIKHTKTIVSAPFSPIALI